MFEKITWVSAKTRLFPASPPTFSGIQVESTTGIRMVLSWSMQGVTRCRAVIRLGAPVTLSSAIAQNTIVGTFISYN